MKGSIVTINTDAGFRREYEIGSYAYWIKGNNLFLKGSGMFRNHVRNSTEAETKALVNAVEVLIRSGHTDIRLIIFNRDNIYARSGKNGNEWQKALSKKLRYLRDKCIAAGVDVRDLFFEFRHVKAHSGTDTPRQYVNNWCDKRCTEEMNNYICKNKHSLKIKDGSDRHRNDADQQRRAGGVVPEQGTHGAQCRTAGEPAESSQQAHTATQ